MLDAENSFAQKRMEVEEYFRFLKLTQDDNSSLTGGDGENGYTQPLTTEIKTILKANAFLILYNLVESTVRDGIRAVFNSIRNDSLTYPQVTSLLQKLWIDCQYSPLKHSRPGHNTYVDTAKSMVDEVIAGSVVVFSTDYDCGISGNLDALQIRALAGKYGFSAKTRPRARGGVNLLTIKTRRNDLAHGLVSFITCGRDYTFTELSDIKDEVIIYLEDILRNIRRYIESQSYIPS